MIIPIGTNVRVVVVSRMLRLDKDRIEGCSCVMSAGRNPIQPSTENSDDRYDHWLVVILNLLHQLTYY
jgi:hypothetical protein